MTSDDTKTKDIKVVSVNISVEKGTVKKPVGEIQIDETGIVGDAHAGKWHRQISILAQESIDHFAAEAGREIGPGEFAENFSTIGLDLSGVGVLDRFQIGDVELEVTQIGKKCHGDGCAIYREVGKCVMPKEGIFCRVIKTGRIAAGDVVTYMPRALRIMVITLSDRASSGEYADKSGPRITELLGEHFKDTRWKPEISNLLIADDSERLTKELKGALADGVDVIITTGGTGIGPRDVTPDVVLSLADKVIPGIMESVRVKFGADKPNALLSRSVAAVCGRSLVYVLPGSVKAVQEYTGEILKTMEHCIFMLNELDVH